MRNGSTPAGRSAAVARGLGLALMAALVISAAGLLLYGCWCAHTHFKNGASVDYARYTNMMWNTAHGRPFLYGLNASYLQVHLSFTLGLLGFLFYAWDDAFLPALLQWVFMVLGGVLLVLAARKVRAPRGFTLALLVFWTLYPLMQSVVLCEFHGVSLYLFLIPLLYVALLAKRGVWIVLLLIVGLREEAGLMVAPLLLYFAVKERRPVLAWYAGGAALYVAAAALVLYPMINHMTLFQLRQAEIGTATWTNPAHWALRGRSLLWMTLPLLPLLVRRWQPLLVIPALAIVTTLASSYERQIALKIHYPAVVIASIAVAMIEAWRGEANKPERIHRLFRAAMPVYLVALTLAAHRLDGFLPGARHTKFTRAYRAENSIGLDAIRVARREIPKAGVLVPERRLIGFVANRADLGFANMGGLDITPDVLFDSIFCWRRHLPDGLRERFADGSWGVAYADDEFVVARRGFDTSRNRAFLGAPGAGAEQIPPGPL